MGKRKVPKHHQQQSHSQQSAEADQQKQGDKRNEAKGKKHYSLQEKKEEHKDSSDGVPKVHLPDKLETALVDLITEDQKARTSLGDVSKRITAKKLTDVYNTLSEAGFTKNQVESAMSNTITSGGDLIDALDWLCLNTQNDLLPAGFSETLHKEEEKRRPKFDLSLQVEVPIIPQAQGNSGQKKQPSTQASQQKANPSGSKSGGVKNWILQYAEQSSDDDSYDSMDEDKEFNPTSQYVRLHGQLQDLKNEAAIAKSNGATAKHKELSKKLREMHLEMSSLEKHPDFDKSIKAELKAVSQPSSTQKKISEANPKPGENPVTTATSNDTPGAAGGGGGDKASPSGTPREGRGEEDDDGGDLGLSLFARAEAEPVAKPVVVTARPPEEVRSFEYTRSQWTGKSPKQFLIDWVRKHLPKSPPPKFRKIQVKVNRFKSTAVVVRQKDDTLEVTPEILTENVKEAEHLASVLALYHLCRGQPIHQLLPPPYRDVWLDWRDAEQKEKDEAKEKVNKPRDQFVSRLMKKLTLEDSSKQQSGTDRQNGAGKSDGGKQQEEEEDWEQLADEDRLAELPGGSVPQPAMPTPHLSGGTTLKSHLEKCRSSQGFQDLLKTRQQLPVYQYRDKILECVRSHNVVVVAGDTGSGKSTQVPQFILEDSIERGLPLVNVVCTQPRRISATSLATRVGQEWGEAGAPLNKAMVGYQIRFESRKGPNTRLVYCTTGVLLRRLQNEKDLEGISHLIIDEVHERSVQSDFLMIVVKTILARRCDLKVILMSATLDSEKFSSYFQHCPVVNIPGKLFPVEVMYLEDIIEQTGYVVDEDSPYTLRANQLVQEQSATVEVTHKGGDSGKQTLTWTQEDISKIDFTDLSADQYSLRTRNAVTRLNLSRINLDLISDLLIHLDSSAESTDGAILIFLPGLADIQEMYEILTTQRQFSDQKRYKIFALHSVLSSDDQGQVFAPTPPGVRKVVIATNIAETGITIPDVVYVIDCGKAKEKRYMESSQMSSLEEVFISKANCKQRAGRAGRVRAGWCFRLYTQSQFKGLKAYSTPELLRVPLEELCLNILKCGYGRPQEFLSQGLDPPEVKAVSRAMSILRDVGALRQDELSPLGHHLASLPVDVRIGKMLVMAAIFGCLEHIAVIASSMTDKSPFVVPLHKRSEADSARQGLAVAQSDHLTLCRAYLGWTRARQEGRTAEMAYLNKHFLKRATLMDIENVKKDLIKLVRSIGFDPEPSTTGQLVKPATQVKEVLAISKVEIKSNDLDPKTIALVKAVLTAGLYPQVGQVSSVPSVDAGEKVKCLVQTSQGPAAVHPSSVNKFLTDTNKWLVYQEKVRASRVYLRDTTVVSPYSLLLFGGVIDVMHTQRVISLDSWISYKAVAKTGVIFKELRALLDNLLERKLREPRWNIAGSRLILLLKDLISSEKSAR